MGFFDTDFFALSRSYYIRIHLGYNIVLLFDSWNIKLIKFLHNKHHAWPLLMSSSSLYPVIILSSIRATPV